MNTIPSRRETVERIDALRRRADEGDALAAAALVLIGLTARNLPSGKRDGDSNGG